MRLVFLFVLLANAGFYAWAQFIAPTDAGRDPQPLTRQIHPEKLKLLDTVPTRTAATPQAPAEPRGSGNAGPAPSAGAPAVACLEWGSFPPAAVAAAERTLAALGLGARTRQRSAEETAGWWVFIPTQRTRAEAQKKAAELRALGVTDYFVIQDPGPHRWAISLGVFRTEEAARTQLEALRDRRVRSAQIGPRDAPVQKVWLQVERVEPAEDARLREIVQSVPGTEVRACAPPAA